MGYFIFLYWLQPPNGSVCLCSNQKKMEKIYKKWLKYWLSMSFITYILAVLFCGEWIIYNMDINIRCILFLCFLIEGFLAVALVMMES